METNHTQKTYTQYSSPANDVGAPLEEIDATSILASQDSRTQLLISIRDILRRSFFNFGQPFMPTVLRSKWTKPEAAELRDWARATYHHVISKKDREAGRNFERLYVPLVDPEISVTSCISVWNDQILVYLGHAEDTVKILGDQEGLIALKSLRKGVQAQREDHKCLPEKLNGTRKDGSN